MRVTMGVVRARSGLRGVIGTIRGCVFNRLRLSVPFLIVQEIWINLKSLFD